MVRFAIFPKSVPQGTYPNVKGSSVQKPKPVIDSSERSRDRFLLRNAWNTNTYPASAPKTNMGSFRAVNNAGDLLSRKNYTCGGANMIPSRPGTMILTTKDGGQRSACDGSGIPPATCNVKYVYDSSDFTKHKKLKAENYSYSIPDYTYGGANNGTTQSVINRVRH